MMWGRGSQNEHPLTLALSLREREPIHARFALPQGEGQGEGMSNRRVALRLVTVVFSLLLAAPAFANEASQAFSARAVILINAGKTAEALPLLDQAVEADPDDVDVRYQRGVVRARTGDSEGAIEDLERALALRPHFPAAALELGIALVDVDRPDEAEPPLLQAQQVPALDAQASFYLALAELRLGRYDLADTNLARARQADPSLTVATQYYQGVVAFRRGDYGAATSAFETVRRERPDSAMAREAEQYVTVMEETRASDYSAFGTLALEYDSNVTLGPTQTLPDTATGQADGRAVINLGGRWTPLRWGGASLSVAYEFFQSLQFDLTDFNLTDNRPSVQLQYDFEQVSFGVLGRYDYYLLGGDSFLSEWTAMPWVTILEEGFGRTELYTRIQPRDYFNNAEAGQVLGGGSAQYDVLNGVYTFAGIRQYLDLGNASRQLWLGYQLGFTAPNSTDDPVLQFDRDQYQYGSNAGEVGLRLPLPYEVLAQAIYRYEFQNYAPASGCVPASLDGVPPPQCNVPAPTDFAGLDRRQDNNHRVIISFERPLPELWEHLSVAASYFGTFNDSNKAVFTYDRNIGSLALQVRY